MAKHPSYAPVPMPPDDVEPVTETGLMNPDGRPGRSRGRRRQLEHIRDQTFEDAAEQEGMRIKQEVASYAEDRMTKTAASNIDSTIDHLEGIRERDQRGSWGQKRIERATDHLADDTERRQRGYAEAAGRQIAGITNRPITPPEEEERSALERFLGIDKKR